MECQVSKGTINYEVYGEGDPIIVLHAMGTDHRAMMTWIEPIFNEINVDWKRIYVDVPAHGKSAINDSVRGTEDMLHMLLEFIETVLPNQRFSLIGLSFGGYLVQGILHKKQELVDGVCLIAPALHLPGVERSLPSKVVYEKDEALLAELDEDIGNAFELLMVYQNKINLMMFLEEIQHGRLLANREFLSSDWRKEGYYFSFEPFSHVDELEQPTLIVLGRQDAICGYEDHLKLLNKFTCASLAILDRTGHMIQIEQRDILQQLVIEWLGRTRKQRKVSTSVNAILI